MATHPVDAKRPFEVFVFENAASAVDQTLVINCGFQPGYVQFFSGSNAVDKVAFWVEDLGAEVMVGEFAATSTHAISTTSPIETWVRGIKIKHVAPFADNSAKWVVVCYRAQQNDKETNNASLPTLPLVEASAKADANQYEASVSLDGEDVTQLADVFGEIGLYKEATA